MKKLLLAGALALYLLDGVPAGAQSIVVGGIGNGSVTDCTTLTPRISAEMPIELDQYGRVCVNSGSGGGGAPQTGVNVAITPTIQSAAYAVGNCMGGFQEVSLGTAASQQTQITLSSKGGLVTGKQLVEFSANPSSSTCTDKSTFTIATADVSKIIWSGTLTPTGITGATPTSVSQATAVGVPSGGNVWFAIVETAIETPGSTTDLILNVSAN